MIAPVDWYMESLMLRMNENLHRFRNLYRERHNLNVAGGARALEIKEIW